MRIKSLVTGVGRLLFLIIVAVTGAALYGAVNDQITVTISPEYYSVFKHRQFAQALEYFGALDAPLRMQAAIIGILATWWYGLFLGIMLGISCLVGRYQPLSTRQYLVAVAGVMAVTFVFSVVSGSVAYLAAPLIKANSDSWGFLSGIVDVRRAFCVGWWHNGAYFGAFPATLWACFWAQKQRRTWAASQGK